MEPHPRRRLGVMARLYLAIAVISGSMWLAVILWGMGPLLLLAHPLVWVASLSLGTIWAVAAFLFLRASFGARIGLRKPRS
jgi:apolipoprotein N-acyltransferase